MDRRRPILRHPSQLGHNVLPAGIIGLATGDNGAIPINYI
jgi:hypothetical protein